MNCKPGDLAVIVKTEYAKELLGHIVQVVGPWTVASLSHTSTLDAVWECKYPDGKMILMTYWKGQIRDLAYSRPLLDANLRPIRPDETPEETLEAMRLLTHIPKEEKV